MRPTHFTAYVVGNGPLARACVQHLLDRGHAVAAVLTEDPALHAWARTRDLPATLWAPGHPSPTPVAHDYLFNIVNCRTIPGAIRAATAVGAINYHDSLLPAFAGYHTTTWSIAAGSDTHGVTWHDLEGDLDAGDVLVQRPVAVLPDDTAFSLNTRCFEASVDSFAELAGRLADGTARAVAQDLSARTFTSLQSRPAGAGIVDWHQPADVLRRLVRSLTFGPTLNPVATPKALTADGLFVVERLETTGTPSTAAPGTVISAEDDRLLVATGDMDVRIRLRPLAGLTGGDRPRPRRPEPGECFRSLTTAEAAAVRERCERLAPGERRRVPGLVRAFRALGPLPALADVPARSAVSVSPAPADGSGAAGRPRGAVLVLDRPLLDALGDRGFEPAHAVATALHVITDACGTGPTHLCWSSAELRAEAADSHGVLSNLLIDVLEVSSGDPVDAAVRRTTRRVHALTALGPLTADLADRVPELRTAVGRALRHVPLMTFGMSPEEAVPLAAGRRLSLVGDPGDPATYTWWTDGTAEADRDAELLGERVLRWLRAAVACADGTVAELPLLAEADRRVVEAAAGPVTEVERCGLHDLVARCAEADGEAIAVVAGGRTVSYATLNAAADAVAARLVRDGVGRGHTVGVAMGRSPELVAAFLGVLKSGAAYLPLDLAHPVERLRSMITDCRPPVVLTDARPATDLDWLTEPDVRVCALDSVEALATTGGGAAPVAGPVHPDDAAYVLYTSGSTGRPKGVVVPHRAAVNHMLWMRSAFSFGPGDRVLQKTPVSFDASVWEFFVPLAAGATLVCAEEDEHRDPGRLLARLRASGVTVVQLVPTMLRALLDEGGLASCPRLREVFVGGERLDAELARRFTAASPARLTNLYGPTEATIDALSWTVDRGAGDEDPPIGRPVANCVAYVVDDSGRLLPPGARGELCLGGAGLALGYGRRPELTAERFPTGWVRQLPGVRLYRTGDVASLGADGAFRYHGRLDDQVKIRGHRVEPAEVESALLTHPHVLAAAVTAPVGATGDRRLAAFVVPGHDAPDDLVSELRLHCQQLLPATMVPTTFTVTDALPTTPSGKIDRRALTAPAALADDTEAEGPEAEGPVAEDAGRAGQPCDDGRTRVDGSGSVLAVVTGIWREILGIRRITPDATFQDLGADSLHLMRVRAMVKRRLGVDLPVTEYFRHATVAAQADRIGRASASQAQARPGPVPSGRTPVPSAGRTEPVAIVGVACRLPQARTAEAFWNHLLAGAELITPPATDAGRAAVGATDGPAYVSAHGDVPEHDRFDAGFFGYSAADARLLDPQHRVFLETCWEAFEDAGTDPARAEGPIGVFAGSGHNAYLLNNLLPDRFRLDPHTGLAPLLGGSLEAFQVLVSSEKDFLAPRVSYKLDLTGPSITVQTGCSTSLVAVHLAVRSLRAGECRTALAGAVSLRVPQNAGYLYEQGGVVSPDGHCRPLDAAAAGTVFTGGAGCVVLKRLGDALRDGDRIHAVIRGSAVNNDGAAKVAFSAPGVRGQSDAVRAALTDAALTPGEIGYVEAHATATPLGDPLEVTALAEAYDSLEPDLPRGRILLGSVKGNVGHTDTVAGVVSLIKAAMIVRTGVVPATVNFRRANPGIRLSHTPFKVAARRRRWGSSVRRAAVSSLGVGGTNAHLVLEQPPAEDTTPAGPRPHLLLASARTRTQLGAVTARLDAALENAGPSRLADAAHTLRNGRRHFPFRAYRLTEPGSRWIEAPVTERDGTVFLFPGQGVQYARMGRHLYSHEPEFRRVVDTCAAILEPLTGYDVRNVLYGNASGRRLLASTRYAQPALFTVMYALSATLERWGVRPTAVIGHSVGEIAAATVAGVFTLRDALRFVAVRGRAMEECAPGAMLAVRLAEPLVRAELPSGLTVAAVNGPDDTVVAGPPAALARYARWCREQGRAVLGLASRRAFHTEAMAVAADELERLAGTLDLSAPRLTLVSTVTGLPLGDDAATAAHWARQAVAPVLFGAALEHQLRHDGQNQTLVEVGAGQVLTRLAAARGATGARATLLPGRPGPAAHERATLLDGLGRLWQAGVPLDWDRVGAVGRGRTVSLPGYPFARDRHWHEPAHAPGDATGLATPPRHVKAGPAEGARRARTGSATVGVRQWTRTSLPPDGPVPGPDADTWICYADADGLLLAALRGRTAVTVRPGPGFRRTGERTYEIDPAREGDHRRLFAVLADEGVRAARLAYGWTLDAAPIRSDQSPAPAPLLAAHRAWRAAFPASPGTLFAVGAGAFCVTGDEDLHPAQAAVAALVTVVGQEDALTRSLYADLDDSTRAPHRRPWTAALLARLADGVAAGQVALRGRYLWTPDVQRMEAPPVIPPPADGTTHVILGGAGRLGLLLARELARPGNARILLASRSLTAAGDPGNPDAVTDLRATGSTVETAHVDVTRPGSLARLLDAAAARWGRLDSVIHAAGVTHEDATTVLAETSWSRAEAIMRPKTVGADNLVAALRGRDVGRVVLFSSTSAVLGGLGLGPYAAANAHLDCLATRLSREGDTRWLSLGWDGWHTDDEGACEAHELAVEHALEAYRRTLAAPAEPHLLVMAADFAERHRTWAHPADLDAAPDPDPGGAGRAPSPNLSPPPSTPPGPTGEPEPAGTVRHEGDATTRILAGIWSEVLGHEPIGPRDRFRDLGGDSLAATRVAARIRTAFGHDVPLRQVLKAKTLDDMAAVVRSAAPRPTSDTPVPSPTRGHRSTP
ncbi:polyketide synthase [Streptomyces sp. L2]|uniref:polyketide synthase n=1 Tax=Streptomyces sp. L2 TaxID=2162665 RepID=UPI0010103DF9|nr:polyketide synthase [Streptomyces sp. L2]